MNVNALKSIVARYEYAFEKLQNFIYRFFVSLVGRLYYPIQIIRNRNLYITAESYFPEKKRKTLFRIFLDQILWCLKYGDINKFYFLWGGDIIGNDLKGYVPWFKFSNARQCKNKLPKIPVYDSYNQVGLLRDKFYFEAILSRTGFSTPKNIMMINDGKIYELNNEGNTIARPIDHILNMNIDAFCKKNVGYGGGYDDDVFPLKVCNGDIFIRNNKIEFVDFKAVILNSKSSWIVQERIINQLNFMAQFHPSSINTIRVVTIKHDDCIDAVCAFARFGVNGRGNDNWSSGGVLVGVDVKTGLMQNYALYKPGFGTKCFAHPTSGTEFKGKMIPGWNEILLYVKSLHELFYDLHSIGWDVCLTENGPMIIEGNDNWDTIDAQLYTPASELYNKYFR